MTCLVFARIDQLFAGKWRGCANGCPNGMSLFLSNASSQSISGFAASGS